MGNDGGSIPKRRELVKSAARAPTHSELKATTLESLGHAWSHDPLTSARLDLDALVSDWRGCLYNYETILQHLMPSDGTATADDPSADAAATATAPDADNAVPTFASTGIKSLRDIIKLKLARSGDTQKKDVRVCPVSMKELTPAVKAVYLVPCGHVFAEVAMKQIEENNCPECSEKFERRDIVAILPTDEAEHKRLAQRMQDLKAAGLTHSLKKDKSAGKKKKRKAEAAAGDAEEKDGGDKRRATEESVKAAKKTAAASSRTSGINNPMAASLTAKVMAEQEELSRRRKLAARA